MKKFNVGVIGYGWVASAHIPAINATGRAQVTAICSSRQLDPKQLQVQYGDGLRLYANVEEILANPEIDIVSICSLPSRHAEQAIRAARGGKHLIIEKPLALSCQELDGMRRAVKEAGVKTCVCFECRFSSQFLTTKAVIDRGLLGRLHYGEVDYFHGIGPWYGQFRWNTRRSEGGSSLLSAGCHALDALLLCMSSEVVEVTAYATHSANPTLAAYEYPSTSVTILRFKNGSIGKCASSLDCLQPYYFHTHLIGSKGSLLDNKFHSTDLETNKSAWSSLAVKMLDSGDVSDHPYQTQFAEFFKALETGREMPLTNLEEAARTHEVIFAADRSAASGKPVKLKKYET
jgi:predicted dehydrogenase